MNNALLDNSGFLPNYLNNSSSDSKYLFKENTSLEVNQFLILKNNYFVYFENNTVPMQDEKILKNRNNT